MKKIYSVAVGFLFLFCITEKIAVAGQAFDSLLSAASSDGAALSAVFDGARTAPTADIQAVFSQPGNISAVGAANGLPRHNLFTVPVPEPVAVEDVNSKSNKSRAPITTLDEKTELPFIKKGIAALEAADAGKPLAKFFKSEGVTIKWETRGDFNSESPYARACPPEECGDKKVIYLNDIKVKEDGVIKTDYKELYLTSNPTFLAVVLAHELTHLSDYKNIGSGVPEKNSVNLFLELNAWSNETYVYNQLLKAKIAPAPNSPEENYETQLVRLHLAIRDYMNGGTKPAASEFLALVKAEFPFDKYIDKTTEIKRKGSMSLAGVVEEMYDLDSSLENMENPGFFTSNEKKAQYNKYKKIRQALDASTEEYLKWRNPPPPPLILPSTPYPHGSSSGSVGGHAGGGSSGNGGNNSGGGGHSGGGGEWVPPFNPNPNFPPGV